MMKFKKTAIALIALGAASFAQAQSNITIFGVLDTGYVKESGSSWKMGQNYGTRMGIMGQEDLGGGLKATMHLEQFLYINDGQGSVYESGTTVGQRSTGFEATSTVGLAGNWGQVRIGRMWEMKADSLLTIDPFHLDGVSSMVFSSQFLGRTSNTIRYDSASFNGFSGGMTYTLGKDDHINPVLNTNGGIGNAGYAVLGRYEKGPLMILGNWATTPDSNDSHVWNLAGSYKFGDAKVNLGYERTTDKGWLLGSATNRESRQNNFLLGLQWNIGAGTIDASINHTRVNRYAGWDGTKDLTKYGIGYTYNLSKRTALYGILAHTNYDDKQLGQFYGIDDKDSMTAYQVGLTHRF